ncbi:glycosyltransferase 61 family protein [uncultured Shimia sp.]|uniref:glycosyltransferase 61 family protein n=1 Tax=uncultured Shimia sp. TaxID=573152 RepID=UPI00261ABE73|nr:glycosyltransferase 61 family protein [uncultured Shimia sp.]
MVSNSISWTDSTSPVNSKPDMPSSAEELAGTWVFGGTLYGHFGHFILESLSRIWALEDLRGKIDGVIFTPKRNDPQFHQVLKQLRPLMEALGVNVEARVALAPTRVETLFVPRQGIGMHDLMEGSQKFRDFMNKHAGADIPADGATKIYISRSKLPPHRGGLICESILEDYLAAEGYEMFHPQNHSAAEQIAAYKAATHIIAVDCSPLHLLAYVGNASQKVGILTRRSMAFSADFVRQLKAFNDGVAFEVDALDRDWIPGRGLRPSRSSFGEMNFEEAWEVLNANGMVSGGTPWPALTDAQRQEDLDRIALLHNNSFHPLDENIAIRDAKLAEREAKQRAQAVGASNVGKPVQHERPRRPKPPSSVITPIMPINIATPWEPQPLPTSPSAALPPEKEATSDKNTQPNHAPKWLVDFRRSAWRRGFYHSEETFAALFANRGGEHLFVTFDDLVATRHDQIDRETWGYGLASKANWSHLGVFSFSPNWYRDATLFDYLHRLRDSGFFRQFKSVTMSGISMGGYAACAFSSLAQGTRVLAFSPQSTLDKTLVPWEERFPSGRAASWEGPYADAAAEVESACQVYLVYDPLEASDLRHAQRFTSSNVVHLRARYTGRNGVLRLVQADMFGTMMREIAQNQMDVTRFRAAYRTMRTRTWFLQELCERLEAKNRPELLGRVAQFAIANNMRGYAERITQRAEALRQTGAGSEAGEK